VSHSDGAAPDAPAAEGGKVTVYDLKADWSDTQNPKRRLVAA
jgi:hypothetical protein